MMKQTGSPLRFRERMRRLIGVAAAAVFFATPASAEQEKTMEEATFGAGCFWCVEAVFESLSGVASAVSGYAGGAVENPTYQKVSTGRTGHAEVVRVSYDPARISYNELLDAFWRSHDPTQVNRQGADVGTQYRTVIFYHNDAQRETAEKSKAALAASGKYEKPIATLIEPLPAFHRAEDYHQDYFRNNPRAGYSQYIRSKLNKLGLDHPAAP